MGAGRFLGVVREDDKDAEDGYDEEEEHSNIILLTLSLKSMKEKRRHTRQRIATTAE